MTRTVTVSPAHAHQFSMSSVVRLARTHTAIPTNAMRAKTPRSSVRIPLGGAAISTTASAASGDNAAP
jgi:hypothetical protein